MVLLSLVDRVFSPMQFGQQDGRMESTNGGHRKKTLEEVEMSDRVSWIEHEGTKILYADYSDMSEEECIQTVEEFKNKLLEQTPGTVVTLTNMTNTVVTNRVSDKFKRMREQTQGISKAAATVGVTGFKKAIAVLIRNDLYYADSLEEAKKWLAEQAKS
jgi:hypothetical protein